MKQTKSWIGILLALVLVVSLAACGGGSAPDELAGKWVLSGAEVAGQTVTLEDMQALDMNVEMTFDFKDGKKVDVVEIAGGIENVVTLDYTYEDGVVSMTQQGATLTMELEDGVLRYDTGAAILLFERA